MANAFQANAFQVNAFQSEQMVSTMTIPLPVNCVMIGQQVYEPGRHQLSPNLFKSIFKE